MKKLIALLVLFLIPMIGISDEQRDLLADLEEAKSSPELYHAMCAAANAILGKTATGSYQAQLDTYTVEHMKKTDINLAAMVTGAFEVALEDGRISTSDLRDLATKCEL